MTVPDGVVVHDPDPVSGWAVCWSTTGVPLGPGWMQARIYEANASQPTRVGVLCGWRWETPDQLRLAARMLDAGADEFAAHLADDGRQLDLLEVSP